MLLVWLNTITGLQKNELEMSFPTLRDAIQSSVGNPPEVALHTHRLWYTFPYSVSQYTTPKLIGISKMVSDS